ncbi:extracellular solute-binding protein [Halobacterium sp. BOL4-2]|uniref:extracellular solute-binding protein n=1 Tax=Halobacterium sp. BOL4-2 TaxID=2810537 RepID=UPI0019632634|nr:extracellular solute-binding protein [Halobacterium sp. BOL4-2]QRY24010.1 extracellular solute-binding protein [Halobacterium sp. BOL4-2]
MTGTAPVSRRQYLGTAGAIIGTTAGCLTGADASIHVLAAGSLTSTIEDHIRPAFEDATDHTLRPEYHGSTTLLQLISDGTKHPDVAISADATLLRTRLFDAHADWALEFASNRLGICYVPSTPLGRRLAAGTPWWRAAVDAAPDTIAVSDPALDPLGYRTLMAFTLAATAHDAPDLRADLDPATVTKPSESQLLADVETGNHAAAVVYENMALDHDLPFLGFPDAYNFAAPERADHYASATYTTDDGTRIHGRPITYATTVLNDASNTAGGRAFVRFLAANPDVVREAGLAVPEPLPTHQGALPDALER